MLLTSENERRIEGRERKSPSIKATIRKKATSDLKIFTAPSNIYRPENKSYCLLNSVKYKCGRCVVIVSPVSKTGAITISPLSLNVLSPKKVVEIVLTFDCIAEYPTLVFNSLMALSLTSSEIAISDEIAVETSEGIDFTAERISASLLETLEIPVLKVVRKELTADKIRLRSPLVSPAELSV